MMMASIVKGKRYFLRVQTTGGFKDYGPIEPSSKLNQSVSQLNNVPLWYRTEESEDWKKIDINL